MAKLSTLLFYCLQIMLKLLLEYSGQSYSTVLFSGFRVWVLPVKKALLIECTLLFRFYIAPTPRRMGYTGAVER